MRKYGFKRTLVTALAVATLFSPAALTAVNTVTMTTSQVAAAATPVIRLNEKKTLWQGFGVNRHSTGRTLRAGSTWQATAVGYSNDGTAWYQVATNQWVTGTNTTMTTTGPLPTRTEDNGYGRPVVRVLNKTDLLSYRTADASRTGQTVGRLSAWTVTATVKNNGVYYFQVSRNAWLHGTGVYFTSAALRESMNKAGDGHDNSGSNGANTNPNGNNQPNTGGLSITLQAQLPVLKGHTPQAPVVSYLAAGTTVPIKQMVQDNDQTYIDLGNGEYIKFQADSPLKINGDPSVIEEDSPKVDTSYGTAEQKAYWQSFADAGNNYLGYKTTENREGQPGQVWISINSFPTDIRPYLQQAMAKWRSALQYDPFVDTGNGISYHAEDKPATPSSTQPVASMQVYPGDQEGVYFSARQQSDSLKTVPEQLVINTPAWNGYGMTDSAKVVALTHELGHAFGVAHNTNDPSDIMYPRVGADNQLSRLDIATALRSLGLLK
ncbi:hypothetical protein [Schleiferilactobacillus shenzhenensis]|uniref:hypothetical protein n=1 Tax=Schleiferilactobacillus shenzhenensis TaxID=1231337 RepID=UPI000425D9D4|nr:hypothetical protein [Schleiferilactobacillus shenzhenensis]